MKKLTSTFSAMMIAALLIFAAGCSDDDDNMISSPDASQVMIIHASPDAPGVDILVDDSKAVTNLEFPVNTGYISLNSDTYNVKVNVTNTSTTVIEADLTLDPNKNYSVFAVGAVANIGPLVFEDNLSAPASGNAHVRFIHLSPDAPAVDIALAGGAVLFPNVTFTGSVDFTPLAAGTYDLEVRLAGTSTVVLPLPGITLEDGMIYTVFAKGFVAGSGDQALGAEIIANN